MSSMDEWQNKWMKSFISSTTYFNICNKLHKAKFGTSTFQQTLNQYQHAYYQKDLQANDQDQDVCFM